MSKSSTKTKTEGTAALTPSRDIQRVDVALLRRDPDNVRKRYPQESLQELSDSILAEGILQNLEAGPDGTVHLGNRRLMATTTVLIPELEERIARLAEFEGQPKWAELAGIGDPEGELAALRARLEEVRWVPVRVLSSEEVKGAKIRQLVENLQREGVSARDEADGYAELLEQRDGEGKPVWTAEGIAQRIGKKRTEQYVRNRLKLRSAPQSMLDALEEGRIGVRQCELVGRVPSPTVREELAKRVLDPRHLDRPLTERETSELIREEYMLSLAKAPFDREDVSLAPGAGGCAGCEFRSGNDRTLEGAFWERGRAKGGGMRNSAGISPDLCTNPACFRAKAAAAWERLSDRAREEGFDVLTLEQSAKVFSGYQGRMSYDAPWYDLDEKPEHDVSGSWDGKGVPKWRALLKGSGIRVTKARHPETERVHDLVAKAAAKEALRLMVSRAKKAAPSEPGEKGVEKIPSFVEKKLEREKEQKEAAARARREAKLMQRVSLVAVDELLDAMTKGPNVEPDRELLIATLEIVLAASSEGCAFFALWAELERPHPGASGRDYLPAIMDLVRERDKPYTAKELCALITFAAVAPGLKFNGILARDVKSLAKLLGVDLDAVAKRAKKEFKEEELGAKKSSKAARKEGGEDGVNAHGVLERFEEFELALLKRYSAFAHVGEHVGKWFCGWSFNGPDFGSGAPVAVGGEAFADMDAAVRHVCEAAIAYFSSCHGSSSPTPASFLESLRGALEGWGGAAPPAADSVQDADAKNEVDAAAPAVPPGDWEISLLGADNPNAHINERRLLSLERKIRGGLAPGKVTVDWIVAAAAGGVQPETARRLLVELMARGVVDGGGRATDPPEGWHPDRFAVRRADDFYTAALAEGSDGVTVAEVEKRFGLKKDQLKNYRINVARAARKGAGKE